MARSPRERQTMLVSYKIRSVLSCTTAAHTPSTLPAGKDPREASGAAVALRCSGRQDDARVPAQVALSKLGTALRKGSVREGVK